MKKGIKPIRPSNLGWLEYKLDTQEMDYVWRCIENKKGKYKFHLAGIIDSSYELNDRNDWFFNNTIKPLIIEYSHNFWNLGDTVATTLYHQFCLNKWWVNYQKQNEFNPLHDHTGVYSFVIWMKIPEGAGYKKQNQNEISRMANCHPLSTFQFVYTDMLGKTQIHYYQLEKEDEGTMVIFPSSLRHQVYPFYNCDEERISVSGNISADSLKSSA
tara:strand:+ start:60 stop:701 length:642 start_codon:yes stop_codon:yes gene_type:complete